MRAITLVIPCVAMMFATIAGCTAPTTLPTEVLDRDTGATVTSPSKPILFAPASGTAMTGPFEYVTLVAVDVNQNSQHEWLLLAYGWTRPQAAPVTRETLALRIVADDQVVELTPELRSARDFGVATLPHQPPRGFAAPPLVYRCGFATWQLLAAAQRLTIQLGEVDKVSPSYVIWTDGRAALREMLATLQP